MKLKRRLDWKFKDINWDAVKDSFYTFCVVFDCLEVVMCQIVQLSTVSGDLHVKLCCSKNRGGV